MCICIHNMIPVMIPVMLHEMKLHRPDLVGFERTFWAVKQNEVAHLRSVFVSGSDENTYVS